MRWVWLAVVAMVGCGGADVAAVANAPAASTQRCPDWVNDTSDGVAWEQQGDEDEIRWFVGGVSGSDFVAFKGAGTIDAPIAKVANVLIETSRHHEWVPHFGGMRVVRIVSKTEKIIYRHVTTPFVISDRDFVVAARIEKERPSGHLVLGFSSVEDPDAPPIDDRVRGTLHESGYRMWPIDAGARTMMIFTIHVDPMGTVPAWIVNLFQDGYAKATIENIRGQAAKTDVVEHPEIKDEFRDFKPCLERSSPAGPGP
jgi:hypothetical protein